MQSKSVMRTRNFLMSHASPLTTLWWILENLFFDRMILCVYAYKLDLIHEYLFLCKLLKPNLHRITYFRHPSPVLFNVECRDILKPLQNKKGQKILRYPTKEDCFFVGYLNFFWPFLIWNGFICQRGHSTTTWTQFWPPPPRVDKQTFNVLSTFFTWPSMDFLLPPSRLFLST